MVNEQMITHWSGDAGQHWAAEQERYDRMLAGFGERVVEALRPQPRERVLTGSAWLVTAVKPR
jgi:hypothetical protein